MCDGCTSRRGTTYLSARSVPNAFASKLNHLRMVAWQFQEEACLQSTTLGGNAPAIDRSKSSVNWCLFPSMTCGSWAWTVGSSATQAKYETPLLWSDSVACAQGLPDPRAVFAMVPRKPGKHFPMAVSSMFRTRGLDRAGAASNTKLIHWK